MAGTRDNLPLWLFFHNKHLASDVPNIESIPSIGNMLPPTYQHLFSRVKKSFHQDRLFKIGADQVVHELLTAVVMGDEEKVLEMVTISPELLLEARIEPQDPALREKWQVTDYSGRTYDRLTAFQLMLCVGDEVMAKKVKNIFLKYSPEKGQAELDKQFNEVFPNGYAAHLEAQQHSANQFEQDYLTPLIDAIDQASVEDLQAALVKHDNGSALCQKLNAFKTAFTALSLKEKVYNPHHLLKVFETYNTKFDAWYKKFKDNEDHHWLHLDVFWRQVIGWEERYMTTNYAQGACTGWGSMVENNEPIKRTLSLHNYHTNRAISFFPLDTDPTSRLGADFAIYSYYAGARGLGGGGCGLRRARAVALFYQNYCRAKTASLGALCRASRVVAVCPGV